MINLINDIMLNICVSEMVLRIRPHQSLSNCSKTAIQTKNACKAEATTFTLVKLLCWVAVSKALLTAVRKKEWAKSDPFACCFCQNTVWNLTFATGFLHWYSCTLVTETATTYGSKFWGNNMPQVFLVSVNTSHDCKIVWRKRCRARF